MEVELPFGIRFAVSVVSSGQVIDMVLVIRRIWVKKNTSFVSFFRPDLHFFAESRYRKIANPILFPSLKISEIADIRISETEAWHISPTSLNRFKMRYAY